MTTEQSLAQIEALISEIEELDRRTGGTFRDVSDREAYVIANRILRKMRAKLQGDRANVA